jgi:hypothetical protein
MFPVLVLVAAAMAVAQSPPGGFVSPAASSGNVSTTSANTYGAFLQDFSAATIKNPTAAGFTSSATSMFGYDSTNRVPHLYTNNVDGFAMTEQVSNSIAANNVPKGNGGSQPNLMAPSLLTDSGTTLTYTGTGGASSPAYSTATNCAVNSASPAACGSAAAGVIAIPTLTTTYTVNTSAVTANSRIILQEITDNTGIPSAPTCVSTAGNIEIASRVAATSFTVALTSVTGITCYNYWIVD